MEKALDLGQPRSVITVTVTPAQLRTIADRLETEARQNAAGAGKEVFYSMTKSIDLMFDPRAESTTQPREQ